MNADWVNPFLGPLKSVWRDELGFPLDTIKLSYSSDRVTAGEVSVAINVQGALRGHVLYEMDALTACAVTSAKRGRIISSLDFSTLTAIGELVGSVTQQAVSQLSRDGFPVQVSAPTIYQAAGTKVFKDRDRQIAVIFGSALGNLSVRVWLKERKSSNTDIGWLMSQSGMARR